MKLLYLDLSMGAAGDMLASALLELLPAPDAFVEKLNALGLPGVVYRRDRSEKCGIVGTHLTVLVDGRAETPAEDGGQGHMHTHEHEHAYEHEHEHAYEYEHEHGHTHGHEHSHAHTGPEEIGALIRALPLAEPVKEDISAVYGLIAGAESRVHGVPVSQVHFHEVGAMDALADVTAVCLLMRALSPERVAAAPVHMGSGTVRCAHGVLPVPAPATAELLKGVPCYGGEIRGELCTPTGAALLRRFVSVFGPMPPMTAEAVGYGMGTKDFETANCVRAVLGEAFETPTAGTDAVAELSCNVDDMTAEEIGFAVERLLAEGAAEVFTAPVYMKKNRPGTLLRVLCAEADRERLTRAVFRYTSTIGVRWTHSERAVLTRRVETVGTPYGEVRRKVSEGYGVKRVKYEYEDLRRIAAARGISIEEARRLIGESAP